MDEEEEGEEPEEGSDPPPAPEETNRAFRVPTDSLLPSSPWEDVELCDTTVAEILRLYILNKKYTHLDDVVVTLFGTNVYDFSLRQKLDVLRFLADELLTKPVCNLAPFSC